MLTSGGKNFLVFSRIVNQLEFFADQHKNLFVKEENVDAYNEKWTTLEVLNAVALDKWSQVGSPEKFDVIWKEKYKNKACELLLEMDTFLHGITRNKDLGIHIKNFTDLGFNISWTLIDIGFLGNSTFAYSLSIDDIAKYVDDLIEKCDNPEALLIEFAWEAVKDECIIESYIQKHMEKETVSRNLELRKWRVVYISAHLKKEMAPAEALMDLGEIWVPDNSMPRQEHVLEGNHDNLYAKYAQWIEAEVKAVHRLEDVQESYSGI